MTIETLNLIIKPICERSLTHILRNIDTTFNMPIPRNASEYQIKKFISSNNKIVCFNSLGYLKIILKKELKVIGLLSIVPRYINEKLVNELGYWILKDYRNNGFMNEALFNTLDVVFKSTTINKIYSLTSKDNFISKHILENKIKFNFMGTLLDCNVFKDVYCIDKLDFLNSIKNVNIYSYK